MKTLIDYIVEQIFCFLECCLKSDCTDSISIPDGLELKGLSSNKSTSIIEKVKNWSTDKNSKYLEFKVSSQSGIYIRLNKSGFDFESEYLTVKLPRAFSFYYRKRVSGRKHAKMTLICHLLAKGTGDKVKQHIESITVDKVLTKETCGTYS